MTLENELRERRNRYVWENLRTGIVPASEYVAGELDSDRILHQPFNPRLSINYNSPEEQEKIKEYIEFLKNDIANGFGIDRETLFGTNTNTIHQERPTQAQLEELAMSRIQMFAWNPPIFGQLIESERPLSNSPEEQRLLEGMVDSEGRRITDLMEYERMINTANSTEE